MLKRDKKYFMLAKAAADLSDYDRIKIGAVIVKKKDIMAVGYNHKKSHPRQKELNKYRFEDTHDKCNHYLHAEMSAIINCHWQPLHGASIYVYRSNKDGIQNCRPCEACMKEIKLQGIKTIYYTTQDGYCMEEIENEN